MKRTILGLFIIGFIFLAFGNAGFEKVQKQKNPNLNDLSTISNTSGFQYPGQKRNIQKKRITPRRLSSDYAEANPEWAWIYGADREDAPFSIVLNDDGGYVVAGMSVNDLFYRNAYKPLLISLSPYGDIVRQKCYFPGVIFYSLQKTSHGGYFAGGQIAGSQYGGYFGQDILVAKLFPDGEPEWALGFATKYYDLGECIGETQDGGCIILALTNSYSFLSDSYLPPWDYQEDNMLLIKISPAGKMEWANVYGGPENEGAQFLTWMHNEIFQTSDGGYLLGAETQSFGEGITSLLVIKLYPDGNIQWAKTYGGTGLELPSPAGPHILETNHNTYVVGCSSDSFSEGYGIWVLELDLDGSIIRQRLFDTDSTDSFNSITPTNDGGYAIAGTAVIPPSQFSSILLLNLSSLLDLKWAKAYSPFGAGERARSIQQTLDGGFVIAGYVGNVNAGDDIVVLKVSANGELGPGCVSIMKDPVFTVSETNIVPMIADVEIFFNFENYIEAIPFDMKSYDIDFTSRVLCWNLNQPPINVSFERTINRSYFQGEAWHTISWEHNPLNDDFTIVEYRVYRKDAEKADAEYVEIATVSNNTFFFEDPQLPLEGKYLYCVTSVDANGNESPRSDEVGNSD